MTHFDCFKTTTKNPYLYAVRFNIELIQTRIHAKDKTMSLLIDQNLNSKSVLELFKCEKTFVKMFFALLVRKICHF